MSRSRQSADTDGQPEPEDRERFESGRDAASRDGLIEPGSVEQSDATLALDPTSGDPHDQEPAFEIAGFRILRELGRGGMGIVYLAEDLDLGRKVALKVLPAGFGVDPAARIRFQREAEIASKFDHPNICGILRVGESEGRLWIAMRYVSGEALDDVLAARAGEEPSSSSTVRAARLESDLKLIEGVARALDVAHRSGVIHRDLKPGNVMVTEEGNPVVVDFGLAQDLDGGVGAGLTVSGDLLGTPAYMAPEQIRGEAHRADAATDVWALGVMLYEMITGTRPFEGATREALYRQVLEQPLKSPRRGNSLISRDLVTIIETALCKERAGRYASAGALADDLQALREIRPIRARRIGAAERAWKWTRRRPALASLILLALVTVPTLGWLTWSDRRKDADLRQVAGSRLRAAEDAITERRIRVAASSLAALDSMDISFEPSRRSELARELQRLRMREDVEVLIFDEDADPLGEMAEVRIEALERAFPNDVQARRLRALLQLRRGASEDAQSLLDSHDETKKLGDELRSLLAAKDRKSAVEIAERAEEPLMSALALSSRGWPQESLTRLEAMLEAQPRAHWLAWFAAEQSTRLQDYHAALAHAGRARSTLGELSPRQKGRYSVHLRRAGHPDRALAMAQAAVAADPSDPLLRYHLASAVSDNGDLDEAVSIYRQALALDSGLLPAWRGLGSVYHDLGRHEEALGAYEMALARDDRDADTLTNQAASLVALGRHRDAVSALDRALILRPDHAFALNSLGSAHLKLGDFDAAIDAHRKAIGLRPNYAAAHHNLGNAYFAKGDLAAAIRAYEEALERDPELVASRAKLGTIALRQGRQEDAEALFREVISQTEDDEALTNLSVIVLGQGNSEEALSLARRAVNANPGDVNCLRNLASAQMNNGLHPEAIETLSEVLDKAPDSEPVLVTLAVLNAQQNANIALALAEYLKQAQSPLLSHIERFVPALEQALQEQAPEDPVTRVLRSRRILAEEQPDLVRAGTLFDESLASRGALPEADSRLSLWVRWFLADQLARQAEALAKDEAGKLEQEAATLKKRALSVGDLSAR